MLGGLTSSKHDNSQWKVPILGDLPLIGNLFRDRSKNNIKKNLYIFLRPTVLKPHFGLGVDEYTKLKLDYAKYQILSHDDFGTNSDPVQRYFFAPGRYGVKNKLSDLAQNKMPIIDAFTERRSMPGEVDIKNDAYYHDMPETPASEATPESYAPETSDVSMPHINPNKYVTPGLLESTLPPEVLAEIQQELEQVQAVKPAAPAMPPLPNMLQRGEAISSSPQWQ